jgi:mono/diheme cytochrome c family protein
MQEAIQGHRVLARFKSCDSTFDAMKRILLPFAAILALGLATSAAAADAAVVANYTKHCASCHGKDGAGKTTMGRKVGAKDFTDAKVVAEIKDDAALKMLKEGLKDKAGKEIKKPFTGKITEAEMKALIEYCKQFVSK